ncbi:response regulator transcription factor [Lentzea sp. NPDC051208]|uniref:helix-turn-helix transcriptional regulator n=1 Tax=Lentzea sp. NPDC051208 TaxID=3154642 RepID=UPI00341B400E
MSDRITVMVQALDPISEAGVKAALRSRAEVWVVDEDAITPHTVAVVVGNAVDEAVQRMLRAARSKGLQRVIAVVETLDDAGLLTAAESGVSGLVRRSEATPDRLVQVITSVHEGAGVVPPDMLGRLLSQVSRLKDHVLTPRGMNFTGLTDREADVLRLVAKGFDTQEIAKELSYSERTVKNTLHDITSRFHLRNRSHAVAYAMREGLI